MVTVDSGRATSGNSIGRDPSSSPLAAPPSCQETACRNQHLLKALGGHLSPLRCHGGHPKSGVESVRASRLCPPRRTQCCHGRRAAEAGSSLNSPPGQRVSHWAPSPPSSLRGVRPCSPRSLRDRCTLWVDKDGSLRHGLYSSLPVIFVECAVLCW